MERLESEYHSVTFQKVAIVCVIAPTSHPRLLAKAAAALAESGTNVICVSPGHASQ
jgi:hypothetical protein